MLIQYLFDFRYWHLDMNWYFKESEMQKHLSNLSSYGSLQNWFEQNSLELTFPFLMNNKFVCFCWPRIVFYLTLQLKARKVIRCHLSSYNYCGQVPNIRPKSVLNCKLIAAKICYTILRNVSGRGIDSIMSLLCYWLYE